MNGNKKSFLLHIDSLDILDELTDEEAGALFKAIKGYQKCEEIELSGLVRIAFSPFKNQFARDNEKYDLTCKRRAEAGSKGGKAKVANASKSKQKQANASKSKQDLANVADSNNKNKTNNKSKSDNDLKPLSAKANPAFELFSYWCEVMGKSISTSKLTPKREKKIKDRLKQGYTFDQIKTAIFNCSNDPFSMGQNDRGKPFNDLELICRDGEKLESFLEATQSPTSNNQPQSLGDAGGDWHLPENRRIL